MTTPLTPEERRALIECNPWPAEDELLGTFRNPTTPGEVLREGLRFVGLTRVKAARAGSSAAGRDRTSALIGAIYSNPNLPADLLNEALGAGEVSAWANPSTPVALVTGEVTGPRVAALAAALRLFVRFGWWQCDPDPIRQLAHIGLRDHVVDSIARALTERANVPVIGFDDLLRADSPTGDRCFAVRIVVPCVVFQKGAQRMSSLPNMEPAVFTVYTRHNDLRPVERAAIRQIVAVLTG